MSEELEQRQDDIELSDEEREAVDERRAANSRVIHEVIRRQGDEELERPSWSLFWSGLAGGIALGTSVLGQSLIESRLPAGAPWAPLIASLGYSLGFLIVILGRLQLFTESTLSAVLPIATHPSAANLARLVRYWALVLGANLLGTLAFALLAHGEWIVSADQHQAMLTLARHILARPPLETFKLAIPAGLIIAAVPWAVPSARGQEFWVILFLTYVIGLGGFAHVVAGSGETWLLALSGETGWGHALAGMILPALAGNVVGGTGLFALLAHAQVRQEL